jgi:hypothetical protein
LGNELRRAAGRLYLIRGDAPALSGHGGEAGGARLERGGAS